ncbi:hypothetical protein [Halogeometricum borinquense]
MDALTTDSDSGVVGSVSLPRPVGADTNSNWLFTDVRLESGVSK